MGVQGMPMIASAFLTNPRLNEKLGRSAMDRTSREAVSTTRIKNVFIVCSFLNLLGQKDFLTTKVAKDTKIG